MPGACGLHPVGTRDAIPRTTPPHGVEPFLSPPPNAPRVSPNLPKPTTPVPTFTALQPEAPERGMSFPTRVLGRALVPPWGLPPPSPGLGARGRDWGKQGAAPGPSPLCIHRLPLSPTGPGWCREPTTCGSGRCSWMPTVRGSPALHHGRRPLFQRPAAGPKAHPEGVSRRRTRMRGRRCPRKRAGMGV